MLTKSRGAKRGADGVRHGTGAKNRRWPSGARIPRIRRKIKDAAAPKRAGEAHDSD